MSAKEALIVATHEFDDPKFQALRAPSHDVESLAEVLSDPAIGGFQVRTLVNQPSERVNEELESFFSDRKPGDLLVVYFTCHGLKDAAGRLYFAMRNTKFNRLRATGVAASFVSDLMDYTRSKAVCLLLDCCYSGAFLKGLRARGGEEISVTDLFGEGRGRAIITASRATEYAFEADELTADQSQPSVFTGALVRGLATGAADRDGDGRVTVDELYDFIYDEVRGKVAGQSPGRLFDVEGDLIIARNPSPPVRPAELPHELERAITSDSALQRLGAAVHLTAWLESGSPSEAMAAEHVLNTMVNDPDVRVKTQALSALNKDPHPPEPTPAASPAPRSEQVVDDTNAAPEPVPSGRAGIRPVKPQAPARRKTEREGQAQGEGEEEVGPEPSTSVAPSRAVIHRVMQTVMDGRSRPVAFLTVAAVLLVGGLLLAVTQVGGGGGGGEVQQSSPNEGAEACPVPDDAAAGTLAEAREQGFLEAGFANEIPYGYEGPDGEPTGQAPEVAREVLCRLGVPELRGTVVSFDGLIDGLNAGHFDMIAAGMFITPERAALVSFSDPDYCAATAFAVAEGNPLGLTDFESVARSSARLGVLSGAVEDEYAVDSGVPDPQINRYNSTADLFGALRAGRIDAAALTDVTVNAEVEGVAGFEATDGFVPVIDGEEQLGCGGYAFRKADQDLRDRFNEVLNEMKHNNEILPILQTFGFSETSVEKAKETTVDDLL